MWADRLDMVFVVVHIVKVEIECHAELSCLPNLLAVEMHTMAAWREITYTLKSKLVFKPQEAERFNLSMQVQK